MANWKKWGLGLTIILVLISFFGVHSDLIFGTSLAAIPIVWVFLYFFIRGTKLDS